MTSPRRWPTWDLVGIFPEGRITDNGELYPFRSGITRILQRTPVQSGAAGLAGAVGKLFSRKDGPALTQPARIFPFKKIALVAGSPVAADRATPEYLQQAVAKLRGSMR